MLQRSVEPASRYRRKSGSDPDIVKLSRMTDSKIVNLVALREA